MTTPRDVQMAINTPNFCKNQEPFWKMLRFLFTDYNGSPVHSQLDIQTYRKMVCQLHTVIEETESYQKILENRQIIYLVYFVILEALRGHRSNCDMHVRESPEVLKALYQTYRLLLRFECFEMPLFGHELEK